MLTHKIVKGIHLDFFKRKHNFFDCFKIRAFSSHRSGFEVIVNDDNIII